MVLLTVMQTAAMIGGYVLENLIHKKIGINHHVVFRKQQYLHTILNENWIILYQLVVVMILILIITYLLRHPGWQSVKILGLFTIITIAVGLTLSLPVFREMPAYVYLLGIGLFVWGMQFIKVF